MDREILEEKVYYYTNVIEDPKKLVEAIENDNQDPWGEWMACSGQHYVYGTDKTIASSDHKGVKDEVNDYIYNTLQKAFDDVARDYAKAHGITDEPKLFPQYPIKKYQPGTFMGAHFDQQEGDERLKVSFVMYLNDDYEGGEISFTIAVSSNFDSNFSLFGTKFKAVPITSGLISIDLVPIFKVIGDATARSAKFERTLFTSSLLTAGGI